MEPTEDGELVSAENDQEIKSEDEGCFQCSVHRKELAAVRNRARDHFGLFEEEQQKKNDIQSKLQTAEGTIADLKARLIVAEDTTTHLRPSLTTATPVDKPDDVVIEGLKALITDYKSKLAAATEKNGSDAILLGTQKTTIADLQMKLQAAKDMKDSDDVIGKSYRDEVSRLRRLLKEESDIRRTAFQILSSAHRDDTASDILSHGTDSSPDPIRGGSRRRLDVISLPSTSLLASRKRGLESEDELPHTAFGLLNSAELEAPPSSLKVPRYYLRGRSGNTGNFDKNHQSSKTLDISYETDEEIDDNEDYETETSTPDITSAEPDHRVTVTAIGPLQTGQDLPINLPIAQANSAPRLRERPKKLALPTEHATSPIHDTPTNVSAPYKIKFNHSTKEFCEDSDTDSTPIEPVLLLVREAVDHVFKMNPGWKPRFNFRSHCFFQTSANNASVWSKLDGNAAACRTCTNRFRPCLRNVGLGITVDHDGNEVKEQYFRVLPLPSQIRVGTRFDQSFWILPHRAIHPSEMWMADHDHNRGRRTRQRIA
ncbi:hypothetical protein BU16DRAFT_396452 [Lophium mytilinum]|uniref:Uncharacterized protein n=1 Tax=Lophium mytilinum TaxID=390894 RepID=A0A6A6QU84_9PEZI|nr:hypothetical protein BU16DRAFT_396452 [Lophium mytilinum]